MSDFTRASRNGSRNGGRYDDRPPRDYPDERPRNTEPPRGGFNDQWQQQYNNWERDANYRRSSERDRDSGYGSSATGHSRGVEYWARLAEDRQYQLEQDAETLKENRDTIADLTSRLDQANEQIQNLGRNAEDDLQGITGLRQDLRGAQEEIDRLRLLAGKQYILTEDYTLALQELDPLVQARRTRLRTLNDLDQVSMREVDEAQTALYSVELIYAKALSGSRENQQATDLLATVFKEGHRRDPYFEKPETRDAQQQLCYLLERSRLTEDLDEASRVVDLALCNFSRNPATADLPWVIENRLLRTKVSLKQRDFATVMNDAQYVWRTKSKVPTTVRQSIEQSIIDTVHKLQLAGEHRYATKLTVMTLGPDSRISDAAIESLLSLSRNDFTHEWNKCCEVLTAAEQRRVGWQLSYMLWGDGRITEALNMLNSLPVGQEPPQDQVDDLSSRLLLEIGGFKNLNKAAKSASDLLKDNGYEPLPGKVNCHHPRTLLTAIDKISLLANDRDDPVKVYKDQLNEYWLTAFMEAKANKDSIGRDMLELLAKTGRDLRARWKENAEQKRPKTCDEKHPERKARDKLLANIKTVDKWMAARQN